MAYIYLDDLKKILPGILDSWIDEDDESWEWIFQEIEQKCYVGKKKKDKKKWKNKITKDVADLTDAIYKVNETKIRQLEEEVNKLTKSIEELNNYAVMNLSSRINALSHDIVAAKSMAQTAKQRTEVNYSKYSGKSDSNISYSNPEDKDCKTCKYYCDTEAITEPCCACDAYQCWEAKSDG